MKRIFIVGSLNMDLCINAPYMPKAGETLTGDGFMTNGGGKGANQATAAQKLGGRVLMCGAVGKDGFGDELVGNLRTLGVDTSSIKVCDGVSTGIAVIILAENDNRIILDKGANACLTEADIDEFLSKAEQGDIYMPMPTEIRPEKPLSR